jgi:Zinc finger, C3HC4 type (RING finger)
MVTCALLGCSRPIFIEPRTRVPHKYCGRTHAEQALGRLPPPHGTCHQCNLKGCAKPVAFDASTGRVHDFCSKSHAESAIRNGAWVAPQRLTVSKMAVATPCALPGCGLQVFKDSSGQVFSYCGRSHAIEHRRGPVSSSSTSASSGRTSAASVPSQSAPLKKFSSSGAKFTPLSSSSSSSGQAATQSFPVPTSTSLSSSSSSNSGPKAPLCVVCQEYKANVILLPCGHICLCEEHETAMKSSNKLSTCPCCQQPVSATHKAFFNF